MIIGLSGRARAGKTTVSKAIMATAYEMGLSAKIYDIGAAILNYCINSHRIAKKTREELTRDELQILVNVGFEKRQEDEHYWLDMIYSDMMTDPPDVGVIPNIRYKNELDFIKRVGGVNVFVRCLNQNGSEFISPDRDPNHESESGLHDRDMDMYITAKRGETKWLFEQGVALATFLLHNLPQNAKTYPLETEKTFTTR